MLASESGLATTRWTDQNHQREFRNRNLHRVNTPICVGGPTSASSFPTGKNTAE
jgi:hypothetical protein